MKNYSIHETCKDSSARLQNISIENRISSQKQPMCTIVIDETQEHQTIEGFGGALTESSAYVLSTLPVKKREEVINSYFGSVDGNKYTIARSHINSCDFSLDNWSCLEKKDETLESFSMERAAQYLMPLIKDCCSVVEKTQSKKMMLMISPWSPPAWMKDNGSMNHGGKLLPQYKKLWASFILRYIQELEQEDISVWAVSIQNEPAAVQVWDSCIWSADDEAEFACSCLGPLLEKNGKDSIKIFVWDHNRDLLLERFSQSMKHKDAQKYIAGAAYHWYSGDQYNNVNEVYKKHPDKMLIFSEGCIEGGPRNGAWFSGERYAHNIINDLNSGCSAWIDWNIVLNTQGGPNHVGNYCDAPILVDEKTHEVFYQSSYYYLGHFSRFIEPKAKRIGCSVLTGMVPSAPDGRAGNLIESCAVKNPDGSVTVVVCNRTEEDIPYTIKNNEESIIHSTLIIPPRSIQTVVIEK
ncbi:MAG TPA: glycoside hydrolase family 30 protein [Treponemataceae bacterium]|nr:glycoside hydrolase family 30 protein [Treponemataceae bacterium]